MFEAILISTRNIQFHNKIRKNRSLNICFLELLEGFCRAEKEFDSSTVNEPSGLKLLRLYCNNYKLIPMFVYEMSRDTAFPTRLHVRPAKTHISLRIRAGWSEPPLFAWGRFGSLATHRVLCEDTDQTARMRSLICDFAGRACNLVETAFVRLNNDFVKVNYHIGFINFP